jgi:hypothetical protein
MMSAVTAIRDRTVHQTTENDVRRTRLGLSGGRPPRMKPSQPAELLRHTRRIATTPRAGRSRRCDRDRDRDRPAPRAAACADRPATAVVAAPRDAAGLARQRRLRGGGGSWRGVLWCVVLGRCGFISPERLVIINLQKNSINHCTAGRLPCPPRALENPPNPQPSKARGPFPP